MIISSRKLLLLSKGRYEMAIKVVQHGKKKSKKVTVKKSKQKCDCTCDCYCPPDYRTSNANSAHIATHDMYK